MDCTENLTVAVQAVETEPKVPAKDHATTETEPKDPTEGVQAMETDDHATTETEPNEPKDPTEGVQAMETETEPEPKDPTEDHATEDHATTETELKDPTEDHTTEDHAATETEPKDPAAESDNAPFKEPASKRTKFTTPSTTAAESMLVDLLHVQMHMLNTPECLKMWLQGISCSSIPDLLRILEGIVEKPRRAEDVDRAKLMMYFLSLLRNKVCA